MPTEGHENSLADGGQCGDPNDVAVGYVAVDVLAQVRGYVSAHVAKTIECAEGQVQGKAAHEGQKALEFLGREETRHAGF